MERGTVRPKATYQPSPQMSQNGSVPTVEEYSSTPHESSHASRHKIISGRSKRKHAQARRKYARDSLRRSNHHIKPMVLRIFRVNVLVILPFCIWLIILPCHAFQSSQPGGLMNTRKVHGGYNISRKRHVNTAFNEIFSQIANRRLGRLWESDNFFHGDNENDQQTPLSSQSGALRQLPKHVIKSLGNFVYGYSYLYRNLFSLILWNLLPFILAHLFRNLLQRLELLNPVIHANVIQACGKFMIHCSTFLYIVMRIIGLPLWLLISSYPRFHWQRNQTYRRIVDGPILEEITYRWLLYLLWHRIQKAARKIHLHPGGKLQGQSPERRSTLLRLIEHKNSFRVVNSLIFGFGHVGEYKVLWRSNEIGMQRSFVLMSMFRIVSTFFNSFFCYTPLFETRGLMAAIGAHSAWNLLALWEGARPTFILLALAWGLYNLPS